MFDPFSINATQFIGMLSFTMAAFSCLMAARRSELRETRIWKALGLMNGLFAIEIYIGLRHRINDTAHTLLRSEALYAKMHGRQQEIVVLLIAIFALTFVTLFLSWRQVAGGAARVAMSITIAVIALFAIETVSLHALDAVFYRLIGPVRMIAWLWATAAAGVSLAASRR